MTCAYPSIAAAAHDQAEKPAAEILEGSLELRHGVKEVTPAQEDMAGIEAPLRRA